MVSELENIFETNNEFYDEWFGIEYNELKKKLNELKFNKLEEIKTFFSTYSDTLKNSINKFLDIPNSDFCKNLLTILLNIFQEFVASKIKMIADQIVELYDNMTKDTSLNIDNLNTTIKSLKEQLEVSKKMLEDKRKEKTELDRSFIELQNKYDKFTREIKSKEEENYNYNNINIQKYEKIENNYLNQIKEKEEKINCLKDMKKKKKLIV